MLCKDRTDDLEDVKVEIKKVISSIGPDLWNSKNYLICSVVPLHYSEFDERSSDTCRVRRIESILVVLSPSHVSSPLIAFNVILKDVKQNKRNPCFDMNGSHIIVITPSVPIYVTDQALYNVSTFLSLDLQMTQDNLHESAVGVDLISVAPISPFKAPLFK